MALTRETLQQTFTPMNLVGDALAIYSGVSDYKQARQNGNGKIKSATKAIASGVWSEAYGAAMSGYTTKALEAMGVQSGWGQLAGSLGIMFGVAGLQAGASFAGMAWENTGKKLAAGYAQKGKFGSGYFNMNEAGYTMRQRSLNAIRSNGLNTQSVLGNEARTYYRSSL